MIRSILFPTAACGHCRCGAGFQLVFGTVERTVSAVFHRNHVLPGKNSRAKGERRQKGDLFAPLCQQRLQRRCAAGFICLIPQQHAELIAADTVTVPAAGIGFFDAVCDLGKADISMQMAVTICLKSSTSNTTSTPPLRRISAVRFR